MCVTKMNLRQPNKYVHSYAMKLYDYFTLYFAEL